MRAISPLGSCDVEEPGKLDDDAAHVGLGEEIALRIAIDIAEAEIIAGLELEVAHAGNAVFKAQAGGDAIVELVLYGHRVLGTNGIDAVGTVSLCEVKIGLRALAEPIAELGAELEEELRSALLASPCEMGHNGQLDVVDGATVLLGESRCFVDDGIVFIVEDAFLPSHLRVVQLGLDGADGGEILLADIACGEACGDAAVHALRDAGHEADVRKGIAAIDAQGEVVAMLAHLGRCREGEEATK